MALLTNLNTIVLTAAEITVADATPSNADPRGMVTTAAGKTADLIHLIKSIVAALPGGDANIATLNGLVTILS